MHQSSGGHEEGPWLSGLGLMQRVRRGEGTAHGSRLGQVPQYLYALPDCPQALAWATVEQIKVAQVLLFWEAFLRKVE